LDVRRLSYFMRIAEDGSLTRAANMLRIAQPALSRQMRLLEEELGVALFTRMARGMRLTAAGEALRASVAVPLRELELALQNIRSYPASTQSNIVLGLAPSVADMLATQLTMRLDQLFPLVKLTIVDGLNGSLIDWLSRGVVDLALLEAGAQSEPLQERRICSLALVLAGPADAALPPGVPVAFSTAAKLPLILPSHHLGLRAVINDAAALSQSKLNIRLDADSPLLIRNLLAAGKAYSIMPARACAADAGQGRLQIWPLTTPAPRMDVLLATRKSSRLTGPGIGALEDFIANIARELLTEQAAGDPPASQI
jgi:DNA-binding transcriptional LysR family regulator